MVFLPKPCSRTHDNVKYFGQYHARQERSIESFICILNNLLKVDRTQQQDAEQIWPKYSRNRTNDLLSHSRNSIYKLTAIIAGPLPFGEHALKMSLPYNSSWNGFPIYLRMPSSITKYLKPIRPLNGCPQKP